MKNVCVGTATDNLGKVPANCPADRPSDLSIRMRIRPTVRWLLGEADGGSTGRRGDAATGPSVYRSVGRSVCGSGGRSVGRSLRRPVGLDPISPPLHGSMLRVNSDDVAIGNVYSLISTAVCVCTENNGCQTPSANTLNIRLRVRLNACL